MKKITVQEYTEFVMGFWKNTPIRFGRAFLIYFYPNCGLVDPDLFCTEDLNKAVEIIFDKYVELENGK